ncbi:hypothetical protein J5N97_006786 [Dioscorea zingiberensis]|uniref:Uncharacterized protein n=1 Tax=Dioscorea zingiberensis TaxID=325984 RepID=A0A9D5DAK3_9LILI|nr:hypothetical protein J5N97_006786 [Dioscorea zingiberensis]
MLQGHPGHETILHHLPAMALMLLQRELIGDQSQFPHVGSQWESGVTSPPLSSRSLSFPREKRPRGLRPELDPLRSICALPFQPPDLPLIQVKHAAEHKMDHGEPHWRTNSSFSPPLSRRWDCSLHSDGLSLSLKTWCLYCLHWPHTQCVMEEN